MRRTSIVSISALFLSGLVLGMWLGATGSWAQNNNNVSRAFDDETKTGKK